MAWRNCKASIQLAKEVDADPRWRNRDHESDGTIGDAAHASRKSDHNPWVKDANGVGVVRARDIDEDLDGNRADTGADAKALFDFLLAKAKAGDIRLNGGGYLIYERKIYSEKSGWAPRDYHGINAHEHHIHVSFSLNAAGYDSTAPWGISSVAPSPPPIKKDEAFMALSDVQQKELLQLTKENRLMIEQISNILLGDKFKEHGDTQQRELASLTRIEKQLKDQGST